MQEITKAEDIRKMVMGFQQSRIILTAFELKIFTLIDGKGKTSTEVSELSSTDPRAVDRLLNALCSIGLVTKIRDIYFNSELASRTLVEGKPEYMGNLSHTDHTYRKWSHLTDAVKKGSMPDYTEINDRGEDWLEAFIAAMHYRGEYQAELFSKMVYISDAKEMLDIGGGSGAFSIGLLKAFPKLNSTVFDLPNVIPITKKYIRDSGMETRVKLVEGNYLTDTFPGRYDFIFLSAIVHINSFEENKKLIQKCADSLNPGGKITILDFVMNENRTEPPVGTFFALNMLVSTKAGDTYTRDEISSWYESAGLKNISAMNTPFGTGLVSASA